MLERVAVVLRVVVELIRVREEIASGAERIAAADVRAGQTDPFGLLDGEDVLGRAVKRLAHFVADIRIGVLVCDDLHGVLHPCGAVVGSQHQCEP